ncbi:ferritin-like domain-containing protein [Catalinimonas niigatensis]|uniref:ferritin-like domain-containing protein n=1 Tax=Catalinimonas niigatensis TaxID=1397264 RepID=UPI002665990C|nr:PA2169 family four-helix-bundle protein [Catalinimonas niigatensis]WPP53585.1 PA2169 family four-helix-bundle protein [Catalinimonas niigatensis]
MEEHKREINILNDLLEKNYDAERGYRSAAENVKNARLSDFLLQNADIRQGFAIDLAEEILEMGGKPVSDSSTMSDLHRAWISFKSALSDNEEEAILNECIRGEEAALKDYNQALKSERLDDSTIVLLEDHRSQIVLAISELENLEAAGEAI